MATAVAPQAANVLSANGIYSARHHNYVVRKLLEFSAEYPDRSVRSWEELYGVQGYALTRVYGMSRAPAQVYAPAPAHAPGPVHVQAQGSAQAQGSVQAQASVQTTDPWAALGDKRRAAVKKSNEEDAAQPGGKKQQSTGVTAESSKSQDKAEET